VVVHVPEVRLQDRRDVGDRAALHAVERREQRVHRAVEVGHLAAQGVDPLGRRDGAREHGLLNLLDVALEALDDRRVVVDDLVEDGPERRRGPGGEQVRVGLEPQPGAVQVARDALAHGDHEARADEDRDLAELDLLALGVVARRAQDHEVHLALVLLDLRAQVERLGVLDGELVQAEAVADPSQLLRVGLDHAEPDETALAAALGGLVGCDRADVLTTPIEVVRAIDDHRCPFAGFGPGRIVADRGGLDSPAPSAHSQPVV
jgi:hypothetical protein